MYVKVCKTRTTLRAHDAAGREAVPKNRKVGQKRREMAPKLVYANPQIDNNSIQKEERTQAWIFTSRSCTTSVIEHTICFRTKIIVGITNKLLTYT